MTITTKVGTGAIVASSLAGLGAVGGRHLRREEPKINTVQQTTKISDLIAERYEYILLDTTSSNKDSKDWETNWGAYQKDNENQENDILSLEGWTATDTPNLKDKLKEKCSSLADTSILKSNSQAYENFAKYCARSVTIADEVEKKGLKTLNTESNNRDDYDIWAKRATRERNSLQEELKLLNIVDQSNAYSIKEGCKTITTTNKKDAKYKDIFKAYERVCIKQPRE